MKISLDREEIKAMVDDMTDITELGFIEEIVKKRIKRIEDYDKSVEAYRLEHPESLR